MGHILAWGGSVNLDECNALRKWGFSASILRLWPLNLLETICGGLDQAGQDSTAGWRRNPVKKNKLAKAPYVSRKAHANSSLFPSFPPLTAVPWPTWQASLEGPWQPGVAGGEGLIFLCRKSTTTTPPTRIFHVQKCHPCFAVTGRCRHSTKWVRFCGLPPSHWNLPQFPLRSNLWFPTNEKRKNRRKKQIYSFFCSSFAVC